MMFGAHGSATPGHSRPHSRPLRLTNYAPKSQTNLPANFYPSNNNLIQALLVLLITNMISADNDDDDKHPLLMMMLKKMLIMPVVMNDRRDDDHRQIYGSTNAPQVPPSPDPPTSQSYWQRAVLYRILYCAIYSTVPHTVLGSPQLS